MDRRQVVLGLALSAAAFGTEALGKATVEKSTVDRDLAAQVRHLADAYAQAWNASDMDAMSALYADDVHWVNIVGMHWQGKAAVDRAHRVLFDIMFRGVSLKLEEIESVTSLPGGAAVAVIRWSVGAFRTPVGEQMPPSRDRMTLVLVPKGEMLLIAHGANIQIDEMAQRSDPMALTPPG